MITLLQTKIHFQREIIVWVTDANYCEAETTVSVIWNNVVDINPVDLISTPTLLMAIYNHFSVFLNNSTIKIIDGVGRVVILML